ncbi:MAG TPA: alpha/beta fold hydrolase [Solirubrobacterales bacterium]|jgi:3-oxoadipate enol-lactonase
MAGLTGAQFEVGPGPVLRGETAGEGVPIVLCHGITATRRYVVHGSRVLERGGFRVVTYDARGHGESDPAPEEGYGYPRLVDDLERVIEAEVGSERFLLGGHSMGAHTVVAYALRHRERLAERLAGLVVIGPVFRGGRIPDSAYDYWDGLAEALERGGVDGFVEFIGREQGIDPAFRDSVLRFTRERMLAHEHLDAVLAALRETPRSRPFEEITELEGIEVPALVVASRDEADPGHPYKSAVAYAEAMPRATLVSEGEGESPLAWQGGRLSRQIAFFHESVSSSPLL